MSSITKSVGKTQAIHSAILVVTLFIIALAVCFTIFPGKTVSTLNTTVSGAKMEQNDKFANKTSSLQILEANVSESAQPGGPSANTAQSIRFRDYRLRLQNTSMKTIEAIIIACKKDGKVKRLTTRDYKFNTPGGLKFKEILSYDLKLVREDYIPSIEAIIFADRTFEGDQFLAQVQIERWDRAKATLLTLRAKLEEINKKPDGEFRRALSDFISSLNNEETSLRLRKGANIGSSAIEQEKGNNTLGRKDAIDLLKRHFEVLSKSPSKVALKATLDFIDHEVARLN
jgi:hypothetical protein